MFVRSRLLSRSGSCSRITLSPFPARSTPAPVSLGRHGNSRSIPLSVLTVSFPSSTYLLSPRSRTYSTNSFASAPPAPSASLLSPSSTELPIHLVEEEHALITKFNSGGAIRSPKRIIYLLQATPTLFALETTEALMSIYVDIDQLLRGRTGKELENGKAAIVRAARAVNECWEELLKRKDIQEDSRAALATRLYPDVLMAALKCEDWKTLETLCLPLSQATFGGKNPVLAEDLSNVLLAYLDSPGPQAVGPKRAGALLFQILSPILDSLDTSSLPSALESLWPALKNHPDIIPSLFFERLLPVAVEHKQVQILKEVWEAMKGRPAVLRSLARHYISFHATTDRTSEIPQIIRDLIDRNAFNPHHARVALHSYYITSSDPVAAARFLVDFRSEIPEPALHRLITQLLSSKWGPGVISREETMVEVRSRLEEAFGEDLWESAGTTSAKQINKPPSDVSAKQTKRLPSSPLPPPSSAPSPLHSRKPSIQSALSDHLHSLSLSKLEPLNPLLDLLLSSRPSPSSALEIFRPLLKEYSQVDRLLAGKRDEELETGRRAIAEAVRQIRSYFSKVLHSKSLSEGDREAYKGGFGSDLISLSVKLGDWELLLEIARHLVGVRAKVGPENSELGEQLVIALSTYLDSSKVRSADLEQSRYLIANLLRPILTSSDAASLSSSLGDIWHALRKQPDLIPPTVFEHLLPVAFEENQAQILDEMWGAMKGNHLVLKTRARYYISFLAANGRTSEIPQVLRHLDEQNLLKYPQAKSTLASYYALSSDPVAAARFLVDFGIPKASLHRLVHELISSEWGPGVTSREETMKEVRSVLEEAFGAGLWAKVDDAEATAQASKQEVERAGLT